MKRIEPTIRGIPWLTACRMLAAPRLRRVDEVRHLFLCIADHFEPYWETSSQRLAEQRVDTWVSHYPKLADSCRDSLGRPAQHTFFYPAEDDDPVLLESLARLARQGYGDVEVHLHHDADTSAGFRDQIVSFTNALVDRHGLLSRDPAGRASYAFIHGNWALDNARPDGRWCGVNNEITILRETGCYADMTLPCAPEPGQTRIVNSIYYAIDDPHLPKSHDWGVASRRGADPPEQGLMMIQGPLAWDWRRRKWRVFPKVENGDLHGANRPTMERLQRWLEVAPSVQGKPDWVFLKLHTHGAMPTNTKLFFDGAVHAFHQDLAMFSKQAADFRYYYVTARQMAAVIRQAEQGWDQPELVEGQRCRPSAS